MAKIKVIGIIAEDNSDFESFKILIKRITQNENLSFKKAIGNGCGRIKRKADSYCKDLKNRGCNMIILVNDLDRNNYLELHKDLSKKMVFHPENCAFLCIPIEEIEAWFLSDPEGLKSAMNLKKKPNIKRLPEQVESPKEYLGEIVSIYSNNERLYLNTKHNPIISAKISIDLMKNKCPSFKGLHDFLKKHQY